MSKSECRKNDEARMPKCRRHMAVSCVQASSFGFRTSFVPPRRIFDIRISSFGFDWSLGLRRWSFANAAALALLACILLPTALTAAPASTSPADEGANPLATKQQIVRDRMVQLEDRVFRLIEQLSTREPEQAAKLTAALKKARELLIRRNMDTTIRLLNDEDLASASDRQIEIIRDLENVLKVLLEDPDSERQRQEEIARLEAFRQQVRQLLEAQRKLEALAKAAEPQKQLADETGRLGKEMSGQKTETQPAKPPAPGSENVERGEQHMKNASAALGQQKNDQGRESQKQAESELQQAIENLEQAIEQLKQEQREQTQRKLQTLLQAMLDKQLAINQDTLALDKKGRAAWSHADDLTLTGLGRDQMGLADQTSEVLRLLKSDGTTLVFPQVMGHVRDDMERVADRLQKKDTGGDTQRIEAGIAETLAQLIESLKESAANPPPQSEGDSASGGQGCNPPLVPPSAELKLLRSCQQRLNQRKDKTVRDMNLAKSYLSRMVIRAPNDGIVNILPNFRAGGSFGQSPPPFKEGDQAWTGAAIAEIPDLSEMYIDLKLDEVDRGKLRLGQAVRIRVDAIPEKEFHAKLDWISPIAALIFRGGGNSEKTFPARATLNNLDPRLRPGMSASAEIIIEREPNSLLIPVRASFTQKDKPAVYIQRGDQFLIRTITVGKRNEEDMVVLSGLKEGDLVTLESPAEAARRAKKKL